MQLYTDASRDENVIGIGYVIEGGEPFEDFRKEHRRHVFGEYTSMRAEYIAMMNGIHAASWHGNTRLEIFTDCEPLVRKMHYPDANRDDWYERRQQCHRLLQTFDSWSIQYIPRERNGETHRLAKEALYVGREKL